MSYSHGLDEGSPHPVHDYTQYKRSRSSKCWGPAMRGGGESSAPTCQVTPAVPWASAPRRSLCRGWSHRRQRCSPPWRSPAQAACGAAFLAKSAEGNFEPVSTHREERGHEVTQGPGNQAVGLGQGQPSLPHCYLLALPWQRPPQPSVA